MKEIPNFELMKAYYPTDPDPKKIKEQIGKDVNQQHYHNTCVIRLSYALNYSGHLVPANTPTFVTKQGGDGKWYGLRVAEFRKYMEKTYGKPTVQVHRDMSRPVPWGEFVTKRGIILLAVDGWSDATGHVSLWDGDRMLYGDASYFARANEIALWAENGWSRAPV